MAIEWSRQFRKYRGLWVAFKSDETTVAGSGKTAKAAAEKAKKKGVQAPVLVRMPRNLDAYIGFGV
jgi:hypothetical protein